MPRSEDPSPVSLSNSISSGLSKNLACGKFESSMPFFLPSMSLINGHHRGWRGVHNYKRLPSTSHLVRHAVDG